MFSALNRDPAALQNLITSGETTFHTTAMEQAALAQTFHDFLGVPEPDEVDSNT